MDDSRGARAAAMLKADPDKRSDMAKLVEARLTSPQFRQTLRPAVNVRAARIPPSHSSTEPLRRKDLSPDISTMPSLSLGMRKGDLRAKCYLCSSTKCAERRNLMNHLNLPTSCLKRVEEAKFSWEIAECFKAVTNIDMLMWCTRCKWQTTFHPQGSRCTCNPTNAQKEHLLVMFSWLRKIGQSMGLTEENEGLNALVAELRKVFQRDMMRQVCCVLGIDDEKPEKHRIDIAKERFKNSQKEKPEENVRVMTAPDGQQEAGQCEKKRGKATRREKASDTMPPEGDDPNTTSYKSETVPGTAGNATEASKAASTESDEYSTTSDETDCISTTTESRWYFLRKRKTPSPKKDLPNKKAKSSQAHTASPQAVFTGANMGRRRSPRIAAKADSSAASSTESTDSESAAPRQRGKKRPSPTPQDTAPRKKSKIIVLKYASWKVPGCALESQEWRSGRDPDIDASAAAEILLRMSGAEP